MHFLPIERWPCETIEVFCRRRFRAAATLAYRQGDWGIEHARRICNWADHLNRERNGGSLAALLFEWHGASWLQYRRLDPEIGGSLRPGTRAASGIIHARWDESIAKARSIVD